MSVHFAHSFAGFWKAFVKFYLGGFSGGNYGTANIFRPSFGTGRAARMRENCQIDSTGPTSLELQS